MSYLNKSSVLEEFKLCTIHKLIHFAESDQRERVGEKKLKSFFRFGLQICFIFVRTLKNYINLKFTIFFFSYQPKTLKNILYIEIKKYSYIFLSNKFLKQIKLLKIFFDN